MTKPPYSSISISAVRHSVVLTRSFRPRSHFQVPFDRFLPRFSPDESSENTQKLPQTFSRRYHRNNHYGLISPSYLRALCSGFSGMSSSFYPYYQFFRRILMTPNSASLPRRSKLPKNRENQAFFATFRDLAPIERTLAQCGLALDFPKIFLPVLSLDESTPQRR